MKSIYLTEMGFFNLGCHWCDDIFAECADVAFMDAWLPEYRKYPKGHSLLITRSHLVDRYFQNELHSSSKTTSLETISMSQVLLSRKSQIANKREGILVRMKEAERSATPFPSRRTETFHLPNSIVNRWIYVLTWKMSHFSSRLWLDSEKNIEVFDKKIKKYRVCYTFYRWLTVPQHVLRKMIKKIRRKVLDPISL
jgi:hypothetical protein